MFSYRHGFHAGNHADVLKHLVFVQLLKHFLKKDKSFWVIDTHAGAGAYALDQGFAAKSAEYESGIAPLWNAADLPAPLVEYLDQVRVLNPDGMLRVYPGSPQLALQMTRPQDRLRLFELHSTEITVLREFFAAAGRRVVVTGTDGFAGLKSVLPPPPRRALVLIDPSYEDKGDYRSVLDTLQDGLQRFATGTYAIWYPQVQRPESKQLPEKLQRLAAGSDWLHVALTVKAPGEDGLGLHGSGMFIVNPPWKLEDMLMAVMPVLKNRLGQDQSACFTLNWQQS